MTQIFSYLLVKPRYTQLGEKSVEFDFEPTEEGVREKVNEYVQGGKVEWFDARTLKIISPIKLPDSLAIALQQVGTLYIDEINYQAIETI